MMSSSDSSSFAMASSSVDLVKYCASYRGTTLYKRLVFIAKKFPHLSSHAWELLETALKSGRNVRLYCECFSKKDVPSEASVMFDKAWVDDMERKNHLQYQRLEADLSAAKASMIKESIRVAFNDLGHFYSEVGELQKALQQFTRTRDYTTMTGHTEEMILNVCTSAVDLRQYHVLPNYLTKTAEQNASSTMVRDKMRILSGIFHLSQGDFANAARSFASVESHMIGNFGEVMSGEDIALGAVLCGIASLEREEIRALLLENPRFKVILDLVPSLRGLVEHFLAGRYIDVKTSLQLTTNVTYEMPSGICTSVEMDIHLHSHATLLFSKINDRLVLQYFKPFSAIRMSQAVESLYPLSSEEDRLIQEQDLESHVWRLIESGKLAAKIDGGCPEGCTLRRVQIDERALALQAVNNMTEASSAKIRQAMLRLSMVKHSFSLTRSHDMHMKYLGQDEFDYPSHSNVMEVDVE